MIKQHSLGQRGVFTGGLLKRFHYWRNSIHFHRHHLKEVWQQPFSVEEQLIGRPEHCSKELQLDPRPSTTFEDQADRWRLAAIAS